MMLSSRIIPTVSEVVNTENWINYNLLFQLDPRSNAKAWFPYMCLQNAQQRAMPHDVWTPMITSDHSLRNKSLPARNKVAHLELLRELARPVPRYAMTVIYRNQQRKKQHRFSVLRKKRAKPKTKKTRRLLESRYF